MGGLSVRLITSTTPKMLVVAAMTLAICAGAARADILLTSGAIYDVFMTDPVSVGDGSENLIAFDLYIVNTTGDAGYDAAGFDGVAFGHSGITSGMFGPGQGLHQHYSTALQESTPTLEGPYATAIDTHFNEMLNNMLVVTPPSEAVNDIGPSTESSDVPPPFDLFAETAFGSQLTGTFAMPAAPSLSLAHIVIKDPGYLPLATPFGSGLVDVDFSISGSEGGEVIRFSMGFPEPATVGMFVMGAAALLRRRRK